MPIAVLFPLIIPGPALSECPAFPSDNVWNTPVEHLPVDARSADYVRSIGSGTGLHPDFGSGLWQGAPIGIPVNTVPGNQPKVAVSFDYADESDPGPYPIPDNPLIEGGPSSSGDRHILVLDQDQCILYELFYAFPQGNGAWQAGSGAIFNLRSNTLRPEGWTSADAAGLPILPGLARCEELAAGEIRHALRFTAQRTQRRFVWPARHYASSITDPGVPPMGQRFRLKADFDLSGYSPQTRIILNALKTYGMILADNGSNWYISGTPGACWDDETLVEELRTVTGANFEAVDVAGLIVQLDSAQARQPAAGGSAIGVFRNGVWYLDANRNRQWDSCATEFCFTGFGQPGDLPAAGNWNGGANSFIGVLRSDTGQWFIDRNGNRQWDNCVADGCYNFGAPGDLPVAGDWNGTGFAKIGVFRNGQWYLDADGDGAWDGCGVDICANFGQFGDLPVAGDWSASGSTGPGVFRNGAWFLDYNSNAVWDGCAVDRCFSFGMAGDLPVAGDWNGDGKAKVGVFRNGTWFLDYNGNGQWDQCQQDSGQDLCLFGSFGAPGDSPVAGAW